MSLNGRLEMLKVNYEIVKVQTKCRSYYSKCWSTLSKDFTTVQIDAAEIQRHSRNYKRIHCVSKMSNYFVLLLERGLQSQLSLLDFEIHSL